MTRNSMAADCGFYEDTIDTVILSLYFLMSIPAIIMNGVAFRVCIHLPSTSTFRVYLKNLLAADILMTLTMLLKGAKDIPNSPLALKAFCCRYSDVIFYLCMLISIIMLGLISLDRFFKIVKPCGMLLGQNLVFSKVMSALVWMVLLASNTIPTMVLTNQDPQNITNYTCMKMKSEAGVNLHKQVILLGNTIFFVVCILIFFCNMCIARKIMISNRKSGSSNDRGMYKTKIRVFLVLGVFLVCFVPYHAIRIPYTLLQVTTETSCSKSILRIFKRLTLWLSATNVCLDPLIYFFLCKSFRTTVFMIFQLPSKSCTQGCQTWGKTNTDYQGARGQEDP